MNSYIKDSNNKELLLSKNGQQVMMEWEKPYMEACIDFLNPSGDVLEIGFGCGYSANRIMKHSIKSYTIIECDPVVIKKIKEWRIKQMVPVNIIEGTWQSKLQTLGKFDEIFFDDFPLDIEKDTLEVQKSISDKRFNLFIDLCIQNHTKIGSKISSYINNNNINLSLGSDTEPFVDITLKCIPIHIPDNCEYRDTLEQKCTILLITKTKEFSFEEAQRIAWNKIRNNFKI